MADEQSNNSDISDDEVIDFEVEMAHARYDMSSLTASYSGNPDEDLDLFFERFRSHAKLRDFTADKSVLALMTKIDGHAKIYLDSVAESEKDTVEKVHDLLKENFEGQSWRWGVESKLLSRKQVVTESIDAYASDILRWCKQVEKPDSEQMSIFVRGLLPSLRAFVFSKEPETFREALDAARLGISVQQTANCDLYPSSATVKDTPKESVNEISNTLNSISGVVTSIAARMDKLERDKLNEVSFMSPNCTQTNASPQPNFRPRRNIVCYRCGRVGHGWRRCYAKHGVDGKPLN